jgi:hypothetical protein
VSHVFLPFVLFCSGHSPGVSLLNEVVARVRARPESTSFTVFALNNPFSSCFPLCGGWYLALRDQA